LRIAYLARDFEPVIDTDEFKIRLSAEPKITNKVKAVNGERVSGLGRSQIMD
jgi:hypothetical protein